MRFLFPMIMLAILLAFTGCTTGSINGSTTSELFLFNDDTGVQIASGSGAHGAVTLNVNDVRHLRVMRRIIDNQLGTTNTDVTTDADFNVDNLSVIGVSSASGTEGTVTAISIGAATLDAVFRDGDNDPTDDDHAFIDFTVIP